jgi:DNA-binding response OmpR family regulator
MFLPLELGPRLNNVNAIVRRRVRLFYLSPDDEELLRIVQARLAAALGRADFRLAELGPAETLYAWLRGCGGSSPRGWLETARPFLASYLEIARQTGVFRPLTGQECNEITWRHPPPLRVDPVSDEVTVGWRRIEGLGAGQLAMLRYLSAHAGRICPRKQLYQVYLKATGGTDSRALPKDYANLLDNALDRLREKVEPIPNVPVLLETKRGSGVRLRSFV